MEKNNSASGFLVAWVVLAILIAVFAINFLLLPTIPLVVEAALFLAAAILVVTGLYGAAKKDFTGALERNELASILASLDDAIIVYGTDFNVLFFNPAAERLFGVSMKSAVGHRLSPRDVENEGWRMLIQVVFPSLAPQVVSRSPEGQYPLVTDISFTDPDLVLRVTTAPIVDESNSTIAFLKIVRDRTPQIAALKAKDEFITVASHQLRGPVTDISWAFQTLKEAPELSSDDKMLVENALAATAGLLRRIDDLLSVSKIEDGRFGYQFQEMDINDFIGKSLSDLLPAARQAGIKLYFDQPSEPLPHVLIDPQKLNIALTNLIENAIRYNVENGEVIVKASPVANSPFIEVSVKDTGIGVPPEDMPKLFTKFFRAANAVKSQTEGSGIGLYAVRGIIRAHGGDVRIESELNRGTTVAFTLPTDPTLVPKHEAGMERA